MQLALGLIETKGLIGAIEAADAMVKTAHVKFVGRENVTGGLVIVKVVGEVAAVKSAVDAGASAADRVGQLVTSHVIPRPDDQIDRMLFEDMFAGNDISVRSIEKFLEDLLKIFDTGTETKKHPIKPPKPPPIRPIKRPRVRKEEEPPKADDEQGGDNSLQESELESGVKVYSIISEEVKPIEETENGNRKPETGEAKAEAESEEIEKPENVEPEQDEAAKPETEEAESEKDVEEQAETEKAEEAEEPEQRKPRGKSGRKKKSVSEVDDLFGGMYSEDVIPEAEEDEKPETGDGKPEAGKVAAKSVETEEVEEIEPEAEESTEAKAEVVEETETEESGEVEETESEASGEDIPSREELESFNVHELRKLARSLESFPIKGRDISKANRGTLIEHFNSLR